MKARQSGMGNARWLVVGLVLLAIGLSGCAARMVVTPQVEPLGKVDFRVRGAVIYDGNREYLPRTISDVPASESDLRFHYTYNVTHGRDDIPQLLPLFNPLTIVGFPIGENTIVVVARLEISRRGEVIKTYTATCGLEMTRTIFWQGETFSELRRKGLEVVRDNIEAQMYHERDLLSKLSNAKLD